MEFFDCNAAVGRNNAHGFRSCGDATDLIRAMDYFGIGKCLVVSEVALFYDQIEGNKQIALIAKQNSDRIEAQWVVASHHDSRFPDPKIFLAEMQKAEVRSVRLAPGRIGARFHPREFGEFLAACAENNIPLFYDEGAASPFSHRPDWDAIEASLSLCENINIVLMNAGYRLANVLLPMMKKYAGLHVETSLLQADGLVELLVEKVGGDRILFGTRLPYYSPGASLHKIETAAFSHSAKERIASLNLHKLLEGAWK